VIDRTFLCETGFLGGLYQLEVQAYYSTRQGSQKREVFAGSSTNLADGSLGGINPKEIYVSRVHCKGIERQASLAKRGLRAASVGQLGREFDCETPRRVLIRIRGVFAKPTALRAVSPFGSPLLRASGEVKDAVMAIATPAGRPIAHVTVASTQKARLYTSTNCKED